MLLEVSNKGYKDFYADVERKKYCKKLEKAVTRVSLDELRSEDFRDKETIEDIDVDIEFEIQRKIEIEKLKDAILKLNDDEYKLIRALFFENSSLREYAKIIGKSYGTVLYREKQILEKLKKLLKN